MPKIVPAAQSLKRAWDILNSNIKRLNDDNNRELTKIRDQLANLIERLPLTELPDTVHKYHQEPEAGPPNDYMLAWYAAKEYLFKQTEHNWDHFVKIYDKLTDERQSNIRENFPQLFGITDPS